ncbi:hypothetical protein A2U01_0081760, partial [Trifolium medium]|nr:hypothetical protein [Trifolium medium]
VAVYAAGTEFDGHIYVEHNVYDVNRKVSESKCNGEDSEMEMVMRVITVMTLME